MIRGRELSEHAMPSVAVLGLGYIGLPTAVTLACAGANVIGVDINSSTVSSVNAGETPFSEPDLETVLAGALQRGTFSAQSEVPHADNYVIAVPTPFSEGRTPDVSFVESAARSIAPLLRGSELVILESTSPPGTTELVAQTIFAERPDLAATVGTPGEILFAHCPERVLPGRIMLELRTNDRIIGASSAEAGRRAEALYSLFCEAEFLHTDPRTAELAKLTENSFRDVNIAFANELSIIADQLDIDVNELIRISNHHPRVNILAPGPGVGGHCIAVDPWFIVAAAPDSARLIRTAREVNDSKPTFVVDKVINAVGERKGASIAALGLTFKADVDDLRESPAASIVSVLSDRLPDAEILAVEPNISELPEPLRSASNVRMAKLTETKDADAVVVLVDHREFIACDPSLFEHAEVIDTRGIWNRPCDVDAHPYLRPAP